MAAVIRAHPAAVKDGVRRERCAVKILVLVLVALALVPLALSVAYRFVNPVSTLMLWRYAAGAPVERTWVPLTAMPAAVPASVIGAEDGRFCQHSGIDWGELRSAIAEADDLSEARGGSTISQQLAKNLFLWPSRSFIRKGLEFPLALWLDLVVPKARLMELYLNIAEWGPSGQFGVEAGAQYAFGRSVKAATAREAALLAAILPNPRVRSARRPGPVVQRLAGRYQARAARAVTGCLRR